ncbi:hypothetical protein FRC03_006682 [Tulasnella sp. 419]|nr:hypothetical protein FRC03_006682 [Tulasnella sp. 419]
MSSPTPIPITVFTGFLGSGKTTIILSLLPQLSPDYKVVLLKNEYGDVEVDSQLAKQSSLTAVSEILNGCLCCVLVGQMKNALLEIEQQYRPDRIIIESSGSAFPATLAFQIRELERETQKFKLDAIITVIDAENFRGYEDTSVTARMQAQYSDLILVNKWEMVTPRDLDIVMDHLFTLNELTPKLQCKGKSGVSPRVIFGLDSKLFLHGPENPDHQGDHHSEVETRTIQKGTASTDHSACSSSCKSHSQVSYDAASDGRQESPRDIALDRQAVENALENLSKESVYRVKGYIRFSDGIYILNWAFGRPDWCLVGKSFDVPPRGWTAASDLLLTIMGEPGEVPRWAERLASSLHAQVSR